MALSLKVSVPSIDISLYSPILRRLMSWTFEEMQHKIPYAAKMLAISQVLIG